MTYTAEYVLVILYFVI